MSNSSPLTPDPRARAERLVDQIVSSSFVREAWDEMEAHARHALSLIDRDVPPSPDSVAGVIAMELNLIAVVGAAFPRLAATVAKARPYIEARIAERELPEVPLLDLLTTLDLMRLALASLIDQMNQR